MSYTKNEVIGIMHSAKAYLGNNYLDAAKELKKSKPNKKRLHYLLSENVDETKDLQRIVEEDYFRTKVKA